MTGTFINAESCKNELKNQCFKFSHFTNEGNFVFTKEDKKQPLKGEIAEIVKYKDGSASALIGRFTKIF